MKVNPQFIYRLPLVFITLILLVAFSTVSCGPTEEQPRVKAIKGQAAPDFALSDLKGKEWKLSDLKGSVVFINFWATWCPPCIQELPSMDTLNKSMAGKPFQMLTVLYNDRPEMASAFVIKSGFDFPVLIDPPMTTAKEYGLTGVPETFIIDAEGILREKFIGPYDWNSPAAVSLVNKYIPQ